MPSETKENYLKAIYNLHHKNEKISLTDLSKKLGVSNPTANSMVKKLQEKGWVEYAKYKPIKLLPEGKKVASSIVRKHRLIEMFLVDIMNFGWEEVHDIAEDMEHVQSEKFFDRMSEMLNHPTVDPHGSAIPDKTGNLEQQEYTKLSEIKEPKTVKICAVKESPKDFLLYLNKKNIKLGTELKIKQIEGFDNSILVDYENQKDIHLSNEVTKNLLVEIKG